MTLELVVDADTLPVIRWQFDDDNIEINDTRYNISSTVQMDNQNNYQVSMHEVRYESGVVLVLNFIHLCSQTLQLWQ